MPVPSSVSNAMIMRHAVSLAIVLFVATVSHAQWYGSAEFLVPTRNVSPDNTFARNQTEVLDAMGAGTGMFVVGTESRLSLDLDFASAGRFTVGHRVGDIGFEGIYMLTDDWLTISGIADAGGMIASPFSAIGGAVAADADNNIQVGVVYQTRMQSLELNATFLAAATDRGEAVFVAGARGIQLDEGFGYSGRNGVGTNTVDAFRDNELIGGQLGLRSWVSVPGGVVRLRAMGMLAHNEITGSETVTGLGFDGGGFTVPISTSRASLVGDLGIEYVLQPTPNIGLTVGYAFLGITDVAVATNAIPISNSLTSGVGYHMPTMGVTLVH